MRRAVVDLTSELLVVRDGPSSESRVSDLAQSRQTTPINGPGHAAGMAGLTQMPEVSDIACPASLPVDCDPLMRFR